MKNLIFSSLLGLALVTFTGCTNGSDASASKCQAGKCDGSKKCKASGKCAGDKAKEAAKCSASGKCGK